MVLAGQCTQLAALTGVWALLVLAGCAGPSPATAEIALAAESVARAEQAGARQGAPLALQTAQDELSRAKTAAQNGDHLQAQRLATAADLDAEYAEATVLAAQADKTANEMQESLRVLQEVLK